MVKFPKTSSFFWIFLCRKSFSTRTTDFSSFVLKTRGPFHCSQSLDYSIISSVDEEPSFGFWWKLCYSSPNHFMRENFVSRSAFCLCFIFVFWPLLQICRVWITQTQNVVDQKKDVRVFIDPRQWHLWYDIFQNEKIWWQKTYRKYRKRVLFY